jgi:hypothetical protein
MAASPNSRSPSRPCVRVPPPAATAPAAASERDGFAGLEDRKSTGRPRTVSHRERASILALTREPPPCGARCCATRSRPSTLPGRQRAHGSAITRSRPPELTTKDLKAERVHAEDVIEQASNPGMIGRLERPVTARASSQPSPGSSETQPSHPSIPQITAARGHVPTMLHAAEAKQHRS